jgi:hypothetical protein
MCYYRTDDGKCRKHSDDRFVSYCVDGPCPDDTPTNADRIRSMSDEEMAGFIDDIQNDAFAADGCGYSLHFPDDKETTWIDWLRQPAEEVHDGQTI